MYEGRSGVKRLAFAIECTLANDQKAAQLARILNYIPSQLEQDLQALNDFIEESDGSTHEK